MQFEYHDYVGSLGAAVLLGTYFLLQVNRLSAQSMRYSLLNALGASLILISLWYEFNWSAFLIESAWLTISVIGAFVTLAGWQKRGAEQ